MNNDELLMESFREILKEAKENLSYISKYDFEYSSELKEEQEDIIAILEDILVEVDGVSAMAQLDAEDYAFLFEELNGYAENFIVDGRSSDEKLEEDTEKYNRLMDLLEILEKDYVPQDYDYDDSVEDDEDD